MPAGTPGRTGLKALETGESLTPGAIATSARADRTPHGFSLGLDFSDGLTVSIAPVPPSPTILDEAVDDHPPRGPDLSDWETLTPHTRILKSGPGLLWSYLESTRPRDARSPR